MIRSVGRIGLVHSGLLMARNWKLQGGKGAVVVRHRIQLKEPVCQRIKLVRL